MFVPHVSALLRTSSESHVRNGLSGLFSLIFAFAILAIIPMASSHAQPVPDADKMANPMRRHGVSGWEPGLEQCAEERLAGAALCGRLKDMSPNTYGNFRNRRDRHLHTRRGPNGTAGQNPKAPTSNDWANLFPA